MCVPPPLLGNGLGSVHIFSLLFFSHFLVTRACCSGRGVVVPWQRVCDVTAKEMKACLACLSTWSRFLHYLVFYPAGLAAGVRTCIDLLALYPRPCLHAYGYLGPGANEPIHRESLFSCVACCWVGEWLSTPAGCVSLSALVEHDRSGLLTNLTCSATRAGLVCFGKVVVWYYCRPCGAISYELHRDTRFISHGSGGRTRVCVWYCMSML